MAKRARRSGNKAANSKSPTGKSSSPATGSFQALKVAGAPLAGQACTIIFVHGIGNKPRAEVLKCQWDHALFGYGLGERSRLAYWVNKQRNPEPLEVTCKEGDVTEGVGSSNAIRAAGLNDPVDRLLPSGISRQEAKVMKALTDRMLQGHSMEQLIGNTKSSMMHVQNVQAKILPFEPVRDWVTRRFTNLITPDVYEYFFDEKRRQAMRNSVLDRMQTGGGPFVVIGHSLGSVIAYDVLCSPEARDYKVELFLTLGSPLGIKEVQDQVQRLTRQTRGLQVPPKVDRWVNIADPFDPVALDKSLANDYVARGEVKVEDLLRLNEDGPTDPHSGSGYLRIAETREVVRQAVDPLYFQTMQNFVIARDLAAHFDTEHDSYRHSILIELIDDARIELADDARTKKTTANRNRESIRESVVNWIRGDTQLSDDELELEDALDGYVSARLSRSEVERMSNALAGKVKLPSVHRIYHNAKKKAFLLHSSDTIQAKTARRGYDADGHGICWAVLDTGIDADHPHFSNTPLLSFNCLARGAIDEKIDKATDAGKRGHSAWDGNGHGTHVAGIIAGRYEFSKRSVIEGIAPRAALRIYKVLNDRGEGDDAKIIKALDHIYHANEDATQLVVHGVNLSLGGAFDPEAYGCGDTPLCRMLRKLWRQGVVVVLAAGNEGYLELANGRDTLGLNMALSIGDPANLDEAIAVGSIHKRFPHTNGVSYFSSRGPTADGRMKPDLVAPGERIVSCRSGWDLKNDNKPDIKNMYVEMSGTSMAAPHVSGLIAAYLSARPEFIGFPDRVKSILLENCLDLKRQTASQGAGMPNLVKMLLNT